MREIALFNQMGGAGLGMLQTAIVVCFFAAILFGEKRIRYPRLFRLACWLLVLSIVIPKLVSPLVTPLVGGFQANVETGRFAVLLILSAGPLLLGASLFVAFWSLSVGQGTKRQTPSRQAIPQKHPLDD